MMLHASFFDDDLLDEHLMLLLSFDEKDHIETERMNHSTV